MEHSGGGIPPAALLLGALIVMVVGLAIALKAPPRNRNRGPRDEE